MTTYVAGSIVASAVRISTALAFLALGLAAIAASDAHSADGTFHELMVQVRSEGLTIRYPKGYLAAKDAPPTKDQNWKTAVTAVQTPIESSVIPLEAKVDRVNQPPPNSLRLLCSIVKAGTWEQKKYNQLCF